MEDRAKLWRRALTLAHPDNGGDEEVFKFLSDLRDKDPSPSVPARPPMPPQQSNMQPKPPSPSVQWTFGPGGTHYVRFF
jgi:hypothetical protein